MNDKADWYTIEESEKLLRYVYPDYPNVRSPKPSPDVKQFLEELRNERTMGTSPSWLLRDI